MANILFIQWKHGRAKDANSLEVDFGAFDWSTPFLTLPSSIGNGMQFVTRFMSSRLNEHFESLKPLLDYLFKLNHRGQVRIASQIFYKSSELVKSF